MKFSELEAKMSNQGINSLAEIARRLSTSPQAVSNWKSRDHVPYHIELKVNKEYNETTLTLMSDRFSGGYHNKEDFKSVNLYDIFVSLSSKIKILIIITFFSIFSTFTYVQFFKKPIYESYATILIPSNDKTSGLGQLSGIAAEFGIAAPNENTVDLSSPSLFPKLIKSRRFIERILDKKFYISSLDKELELISILANREKFTESERKEFLPIAVSILSDQHLSIEKDAASPFSTIRVKTFDPTFSRDLAVVVLENLESLNRFFRSQNVNDRIKFINSRIQTVDDELKNSEISLKNFYEKNQQLVSPSLRLEEERLRRNVEVQKNVFLTLKQQLELAKIEEIQEASIVQILDKPQVPLDPININLLSSVLMSILFGIIISLLVIYTVSFMTSEDIEDQKR